MLPVCYFISPSPRCTQQEYQVELISWQKKEMNSKLKLWGLPTLMQLLSCSCSSLRFLYWLFQLSDCGFMWWMCHIWSWIFPHVFGTAVGTNCNHWITGVSFMWHTRSMSILSSRRGREHFPPLHPATALIPAMQWPPQAEREAVSKWVTTGSGFCCSPYTATAASCEGRQSQLSADPVHLPFSEGLSLHLLPASPPHQSCSQDLIAWPSSPPVVRMEQTRQHICPSCFTPCYAKVNR